VRGQFGQSQAAVSNSSIGVRYNVEHATRTVWRTSPAYGVGLKYFNTYAYGPFAVAANNIADNELAESGVIGLAGFIVLQGAVLSAGFRRGRTQQLAAAGFGAVAGLLAHGMVDIYWTAGTVTLPFIIMGMALAREPATSGLEHLGDRDHPVSRTASHREGRYRACGRPHVPGERPKKRGARRPVGNSSRAS